MNRPLRNVSLRDYQTFLHKVGCRVTRTKGGHEHWTRADLPRPITVQPLVNPVPEFIIKNALRTLGMTKEDFWRVVEG